MWTSGDLQQPNKGVVAIPIWTFMDFFLDIFCFGICLFPTDQTDQLGFAHILEYICNDAAQILCLKKHVFKKCCMKTRGFRCVSVAFTNI